MAQGVYTDDGIFVGTSWSYYTRIMRHIIPIHNYTRNIHILYTHNTLYYIHQLYTDNTLYYTRIMHLLYTHNTQYYTRITHHMIHA